MKELPMVYLTCGVELTRYATMKNRYGTLVAISIIVGGAIWMFRWMQASPVDTPVSAHLENTMGGNVSPARAGSVGASAGGEIEASGLERVEVLSPSATEYGELLRKSVEDALRSKLSANQSLPPFPSEGALKRATAEEMVATPFMQALYSRDLLSSNKFIDKVRGALRELREQRDSALKLRDKLTGQAVSRILRRGNARPGMKRKTGELGAAVGVVNFSGWVAIPREDKAYLKQDIVTLWPLTAADFLSRMTGP